MTSHHIRDENEQDQKHGFPETLKYLRKSEEVSFWNWKFSVFLPEKATSSQGTGDV